MTSIVTKKRKYIKAKKEPYERKVMSIPKGMMMCKKELKYFIDNTWTAETMDTVNGNGPSLNAGIMQIPSGTSYNTRTGFEIWVKYIKVRGYTQSSTSINFDSFRIDFIRDNQPQGIIGTNAQQWSAIYGGFYSAAPDYLNAFLDPHQRNRFAILKSIRRVDENYLFAGPVGTANGTANAKQHFFEFTIPINRKVRYLSSSTGQPSGGFGDIYAFAWSTTDSDVPKVWMNTEVAFYDSS